MTKSIAEASAAYRTARQICVDVIGAARREFVEPEGVKQLLAKAREAYTVRSDEEAALKQRGQQFDQLFG